MTCTCCRNEFQVKHIGFHGCKQKQFYEFQWTENRLAFLIYRLAIFLYTFSWILYNYLNDPRGFYPFYFLSNLSEVLLNLYFLWSLLVSAVGLYHQKQGHQDNDDDLKWYHKVNWILFNTNAVAAIFVGVVYWAIIAPYRDPEINARPEMIHMHATNILLTIIDLFLVSFPVRLLHFVHSALYILAYVVYNLILHWTETISDVYPILDWENNLGLAAGLAVSMVLAIPVIIQPIIFGLFRARQSLVSSKVDRESNVV